MICENCHKHKATINWVGEGGIFAYSHGMAESWCECCALKAQIKHIRGLNRSLLKLERKLSKLKCK
jgi:hypothetical protein